MPPSLEGIGSAVNDIRPERAVDAAKAIQWEMSNVETSKRCGVLLDQDMLLSSVQWKPCGTVCTRTVRREARAQLERHLR